MKSLALFLENKLFFQRRLRLKLYYKTQYVLAKIYEALRKKTTKLVVYSSLNDLDTNIEYLFPDLCTSDCLYLEAGANDGISQSNTLFLEKRYKARGILIEPIPNNYHACCMNRSSSNLILNKALVGDSTRNPFVCIKDRGLVSSVSSVGQQNTSENILANQEQSYVVGSISLLDLRIKHNIKRINFLSLDVEGFEVSILQTFLDSLIEVDVFLIETKKPMEVYELLGPSQYSLPLSLSHHDYVYVRKTWSADG